MAYNAPVFNRISRAAILAVWLILPVSVFAGNVTVLVLPFENETGDSSTDWLGEGLADLMVQRLQNDSGLYAFSRDERLAVLKKAGIPAKVSVSRATAIQLGWDAGADFVVLGTMTGKASEFGIEARVIDLEKLGVIEGGRVSGKIDEVIRLVSVLASQIDFKVNGNGLTVLSGVRSSPPPSAFEKYIRGLLSEDPATRIGFLKDAVRQHPAYAAPIFELGRAYHVTHDYKSSLEWLDRVGVGDPEYLEARFLQGLNAYYTGDYDSAAAIFANLPACHATLMNQGAALAHKGDLAQAMLAWRRAADLDPLQSDTFFNLGYVGLNQGDTSGAIRDLEHFLKLEGRDGEALFVLGRAYERAGRAEDAQRVTADAIRISPRVERWSTQIPSDLQRLSTEFPAAISRPGSGSIWNERRIARRAASQSLGAWLGLASRQIDTEFYGAAIRQLREILSIFPKSAEPHEMLARVYEQQREYASAVRELETAVVLEPSVGAYVTMARIYRVMNQTDRAAEAVNQALKLDPGNPVASGLKTELERAPRPARRRP